MLPILHYYEGMILPENGTYYLVAANGTFLHKDNGHMSGFIKVDSVAILDDFSIPENSFKFKLTNKVPGGVVRLVQTFFKRVVEQYRSEACTVLLYNNTTGEYQVQIPQQTVSHASVRYVREPAPEGFIPLGTIHSHADFSAFHSGTDDADEESFDGVHVTFGHNHRDEFSISASIVMNGQRSIIDPMLVLDGIEQSGNYQGHDTYKLIITEPVQLKAACGTPMTSEQQLSLVVGAAMSNVTRI